MSWSNSAFRYTGISLKKKTYFFLMKEGTYKLLSFVFLDCLFSFLLKAYLYFALPDGTECSDSSKFHQYCAFYLLPNDG